MHKLKKGIEAFTVVDGKYEGRTYKPGIAYEDIPPQEAGKFERIKEETPAVEAPASGKAGRIKPAAAPEKEEVAS